MTRQRFTIVTIVRDAECPICGAVVTIGLLAHDRRTVEYRCTTLEPWRVGCGHVWTEDA